MRTRSIARTTAVLLVTLTLALPAAHAAEVAGPIYLSSALLHSGDTLFVNTSLTSVSGNVTSLSFVFEGNSTAQTVSVSDNLTSVNTWYRTQHFFDGSEAFDHYVLQYVEACDASGCSIDSTNLTDGSGQVPSFDLVPTPSAPSDLVATSLSVVGNATAGSHVLLYGTYANQGNGSAEGFAVSLYLDDTLVAQEHVSSLAPGGSGSISAGWTATPGYHMLTLVVDDGNAVAETNEANNKLWRFFFVRAPADLGIDLVGVTHERLRTEAGDLPHPLPRHTIHMVLTNDGDEPVNASVSLYATAQTRIAPVGTASPIAMFGVVVPAHGSVAIDHVWEPLVTLGDVTIHGTVSSPLRDDPNPANNHDEIRDFVVVGGLGGATLR